MTNTHTETNLLKKHSHFDYSEQRTDALGNKKKMFLMSFGGQCKDLTAK